MRCRTPHPSGAGRPPSGDGHRGGWMIPDDPELRRALDARSGEPSPEFRGGLHQALARGRPAANWIPAIAVATVIVLTVASVGALLAARNLAHPPHGGLVSGARTASPTTSPTESLGVPPRHGAP